MMEDQPGACPPELLVEFSHVEVENWLDLLYTGVCQHTAGIQHILHTFQVDKDWEK